ncbi:hypothetical protein CL622_03905 [archaeon]|nr:hypothetical protein [archaeon]|tara:strand:- start:1381 stop:2568 length:1188 start_codon:yes stop_codon:yes gene_type:complete
MIHDYFNFAILSVRHRALRSWLTIIGIVIGVAAIMALIMVSVGLKTAIKEQFDLFGSERILISAQGFQGPGTLAAGLTKKDVETVKSIGSFKYVAPALFRQAEVRFKNEVKFTSVSGFPAKDFEEAFGDIGVDLTEGRMFRKGEKGVAVIGFRVATEMFDEDPRIKSRIKINGESFKVIGIFEEIGNSQDDNAINVPMEDARVIFKEPNAVDGIMAQAKPGADIPFLQKRVERALERARDDENFQVLTAAQILDQINTTLAVVQVVLIGIAAISLLVGGIGIMNSMYTSVVERTRDIGIMKAIGATKNDIIGIFLMESGLVGLFGGIIGVALGTGLAFLVGFIADQAGFSLLKITINWGLILFGLGFAVVIGMISGTLPAVRASRLKPVDALRYE